jgi:hypothetical protein
MSYKIHRFPTQCNNLLTSDAVKLLLSGKVMIGRNGYAYMVRTGSGTHGQYETYFYHIGSWCVCYNLPCEWWREATAEECAELVDAGCP